MPISSGGKLAHYEVLAPLGAGAMGEVWRAKDTRLGREVAIKVLPEHFADDSERLKRFEREARALATLNHPNVAQIHGVDQVGDTCFLVLELVPGESLQARLKRGALPVTDALDICRQIASGLEAAHEAGVIHRDLKPANVLLAPDGQVKLIDFGLSRPAREAHELGSTTDSVLATETGRLLGTPTYMAPEQARGKPIDRRVDIWAFGCVLYECLAGKRAFAGETLTDILSSVLHVQPDLDALPRATPRAVRELIARCFEKDPRQRMRDMGEARLLLERGLTQGPADAPTAQPPARSRAWRVALAWAASLGAAVYATHLVVGRRVPPLAPIVRTCINLPLDLRLGDPDGSFALSPDGRTLVLCGGPDELQRRMWLRPLDSLTLQPLSGTDGANYPFWSPDGRTIGFFAQGKLKRIPAGGGSVSTVCAALDPRGGTWTERDEIVFTPSPFGGLFRVPAAGGVPQALTKAEGRESHRVPHALPGGRGVLFSVGSSERDGIRHVDLDSGAIASISDDPSDAQYVDSGALVFVRAGNLMCQHFDLQACKLTGQPRRIAERVPFAETRMSGRYCASSEGTLVYQSTGETCLEWFDFEGRSLGRIGAPALYQDVIVSPDARWVMASMVGSDGGSEVWRIDGQSGVGAEQPEMKNCASYCWSPDSRSCAYSVASETSIHCVTFDGSAAPRLISSAGPAGPTDWSRDGAWLAVMRQMQDTAFDVAVMRADGSEALQLVAATAASEVGGLFSPDSRWIGFGSDQGGQYRMYIAPVGRPGLARAITNFPPGSQPAWLDDGRLVYQAVSGELCELSVTFLGEEVEVGEQRFLFGGRKVPTAYPGKLSIARDAKRLLVIVPENGAGEPPLVVVQHGLGAGGADAR